jgi:DNA-binding LacI/PurR family transcriptional regulator
VALVAGVSLGTVSRVIRAAPDVSPALRKRVEHAIAQLGYEPHSRVRRAERPVQGARIISFVLSNRSLQHPLHSRILHGAETFCSEAGYAVVYRSFRYLPQMPSEDIQLPELLKRHEVASSVILAGTNYANLLQALRSQGIPYVTLANNVIGEKSAAPGYDQVRFDDVQGAADATRYLLELGHRDIWFIGDPSTPWCRDRYAAYARVMAEAALAPKELAGGVSDDQREDGQHTFDLLHERKVPISAILAGTEETAYGVRESIRRHCLEIPRDISLIGFDDQYEEQRVPGMTTVRVDSEEIGRQLAKVAVQKIQNPHTPVPEVVVPTRLIRRSSCRPIFQNIRNQAAV